MEMVERRVISHHARGRALGDEMLHFFKGRIFNRAKEPRHRKGSARIGKGAAGFNRFIPQPTAQIAGHEGIACAEHVINFDRKARAFNAVFDIVRNSTRKHHAPHRAALHYNRAG